ncbi:hypothetical protein [Martelella radicis]|uniref:Uncharacterized protein n=1 Tax=Martelella radicis TaxID=1397476 RepID=A0A7W6KN43_9HYPH|nr:hypothetical protein [Martelella radicis]MBB4124348.1 hypothetical protein [Martelella radicis]
MNRFIRSAHRWIALAFTLAVIANIVGMIMGLKIAWIGFLALVPLIPLLISGLYLFALPYIARMR